MASLPLLALVVFLQVTLLIAVTFFIIRALVQILSDMTDVPFVRTRERYFSVLAEALAIQSDDVVYEPGSGDGSFMLWCARTYPDARFLGIERNPLLVWYAQHRVKRAGLTNVSFVREDLFLIDYSEATKIYTYLIHRVMNRLLPKLSREFKGALASRAFAFLDKKAERTIELSKKKGSFGQHLLHLYTF